MTKKCFNNRSWTAEGGMGIRLKNKIDILFFNQQFESEPQIALIADEKPPARISHRVSSQQAALT